MRVLPPFDALVAFDAAARLRSMTHAAGELGLTQSAVSHRIRKLEAFMGAPLLLRQNAGLAPTPAGEALIEGLDGLLAEVAGLKARCLAAAGPERLRVGVGAALAHNWLLRRLPEFTSLHPDLSIELEIVESEAPEQVAGLDVRLLWVPTAELRATSTQRPLFQERVFPVCHPALLPPDFVLGDSSVLRELTLLHKGPPGRATSAEWSWSTWLDRLGLPPRTRESLRFAAIGPAVAAARAGAGVVLARSLLLRDALADGGLVRILPPEQDLYSTKAYVIRWPSARRECARLKIFADWLWREAMRCVDEEPAALTNPR